VLIIVGVQDDVDAVGDFLLPLEEEEENPAAQSASVNFIGVVADEIIRRHIR
jgi:hypothetical protein